MCVRMRLMMLGWVFWSLGFSVILCIHGYEDGYYVYMHTYSVTLLLTYLHTYIHTYMHEATGGRRQGRGLPAGVTKNNNGYY